MKINLQTRNGRRELPPRGKPYRVTLQRGIGLGYRRLTDQAGSWTVIGSDGQCGQWTERFALADDTVPADGVAVLSYPQAAKRAIKLAEDRAKAGMMAAHPIKTIDDALTAYELDLKTRGQNPYNARLVRYHMSPTLLPTPLNQITNVQLRQWRDGLLAQGMTAATLNRVLKPCRAAFNCAADQDERIAGNARAWLKGLPILTDVDRPRNAVLTDAQVTAILAECDAISPEFGLFMLAHAETGARTDQLARALVVDFRDDRLMVPLSGKGKNKMANKLKRVSVPLTPALIERLRAACVDRDSHEPLFRRADGAAWNPKARDSSRLFERAVRTVGIKPIDGESVTTIYLRHSSIVRNLRAGVPAKTVADMHNTSIRMIETNYAAFMRDSHDDIIRSRLVSVAPKDNVTALRQAS